MSPQQPRFRLNRHAVLLGIISAMYPVAGYCIIAGHADFVIGNAEAITADGKRRVLAKGSEINSGDAINTALGARVQVRFLDGGYVSLQPDTVFRVDEFNYKNKTDGEEKGFFSLLKGGLRAITGAIGHFNRNTYRVATPTATIGIRGTGYRAEIRDEGLFVSVGEGAISLTNNAGLLVVNAGHAAYVANKDSAPVPTGEQPHTPPQGLQTPTLVPVRDSVGNLLKINLTSGSGYAMAYAYTGKSATGTVTVGSVGLPVVTTIFNGSNQLTQYSSTNDAGLLGTGTAPFSASDGVIGWGRWVGGTYTSVPLIGFTGTFDYVAGIPTAAMPTTGTATYSLLGYTNPTDTVTSSTGYKLNGVVSANFGALTVGTNITVANSIDTYVVNGTANITGSTFSGSPTTTSPTNSCGSGCTSSINGFFTGVNASRLGLSYSIAISGPGSHSIQGVAAFTRN